MDVFAGERRLIILDEAFNGLDPTNSLVLKRHLRWRLKERGATLVLATHALDIVEHYADHAGSSARAPARYRSTACVNLVCILACSIT